MKGPANHFLPATPDFDALLFRGLRSGVPEAKRSPTIRAKRAQLKSRRDDMIIAPGKRSAARGYGRKMIASFFPSGLARLRRAKPEGKKEIGWGGSLPGAAAAAALPRAIIMPPLAGLRRPGTVWRLGQVGLANQVAALEAGSSSCSILWPSGTAPVSAFVGLLRQRSAPEERNVYSTSHL